MFLRKLFLLTGIIVAFSSCEDPVIKDPIKVETEVTSVMKFGYNLNEYHVINDTIRSGDTFGKILENYGVGGARIFEASESLRNVYNVRRIQVGKPYTILAHKDSIDVAQVFIYQPSKVDYVAVDLQGEITSNVDQLPVTYRTKVSSGVIESSLSQAMDDQGLSIVHAHELSEIFRWSIDFFKLQKGDQFKLIYTEKYINDSIYAGLNNIEAAVFYQGDEPYYGFEFVADTTTNVRDYYDEKGKTLRSFFLKAPVQYSRISSRYSPRRFHPVQRRWKAHKGTDYAAPLGTPIMSTANGTVIKTGYTSGNGRYVKVKHNGEFTTQYLHMSKILVQEGQRVKQGEVIGRVGKTGLATGYHVCYRFWRNGRQVDPYKQDLPAAEPLKPDVRQAYLECIQDMRSALDAIPLVNSIITNDDEPEPDTVQ